MNYHIRLIYKRKTDEGEVSSHKTAEAAKRKIKREQKWDKENLSNPEDWSYLIRRAK